LVVVVVVLNIECGQNMFVASDLGSWQLDFRTVMTFVIVKRLVVVVRCFSHMRQIIKK
jgi:hypothetical protein